MSKEYSAITSAVQMGFSRLGDEEYWSMNHHGNNVARLLAIENGMNPGSNWMTLDRAFKEGFTVANNMIEEFDYNW